MRTYTAHFTPEAWIRDQAIEIDAGGPQEWDCTAWASQEQDYLQRLYDDPGHGDITRTSAGEEAGQ